jgi:hypothetical protein
MAQTSANVVVYVILNAMFWCFVPMDIWDVLNILSPIFWHVILSIFYPHYKIYVYLHFSFMKRFEFTSH